MSRHLVVFGLLFPLAPAVAHAQALTIDHRAVACVVAGKFPRIDARIEPVERLARARTFFHADDDMRWYYVEMKAEGGAFHGVLPQPLKTTKRLHYYVEATNEDVSQRRTQEFAAAVVADAGVCPNKGMVATMAAVSKVVVGAPAGASATPVGFAANTVAAAGGAAGGGGLGATALVLGGVAVAGGAAAAAVVVASGGEEGGGDSGGGQGPSGVHSVEGIVYNDACCPAGPVDPNIPRAARRIVGAAVSSSLDSTTTTTDDKGFFRLSTQTRCQGSSGNYTLRIVASGCDPLSVTREWGCVSTGGPGGIPHALNMICR